MKLKRIVKLFIAVMLIVFLYFEYYYLMPQSEVIKVEDVDNKVELNLKEQLYEDVQLEFCPSQECYELYKKSFLDANKEIKCAFYEFDVVNLSKILEQKAEENVSIQLVIDNEYLEEEGLLVIKNNPKIQIKSDIGNSKYMHNKFCVIDGQTLITGSTNPTENGLFKNNNNMIKIKSNYLSKNYENEFDQLYEQHFGYTKSSVLQYNNITLIYQNETYIVSSYFCPQDNCPEQIMRVLSKAEREIQFASFSFTYDDYSNLLIEKANQGLNVTGIVENRMRNVMGSDYKAFNDSLVNVFLDKNPDTMHHKLFVVDEKYVVTGSMNPSANAAKYNDENILIIENTRLAKLYKEEIESLIK